MSESALVAAIRPKSYGSSTIGVKKSNVCTSAMSGLSKKTPASSLLPYPTSTRASVAGDTRSLPLRSSAAPSFAAQPAHVESSVRRMRCEFIERSTSMSRQLLFLPGPVTVAEPVLEALGRPLIDHRGPEFASLLKRVTAALAPVFGTNGEILVLGSSGTGALEAAVVNLFAPGERLLLCAVGAFGKRFAAIAQSFGCIV